MVTHSLGTVSGLKILVSAVRFCPWPHFPSLEFNQLQALRSRLIPYRLFTLKLLCSFCILLVERVELVELVRGFAQHLFFNDGISAINRLGSVSDHLHCR